VFLCLPECHVDAFSDALECAKGSAYIHENSAYSEETGDYGADRFNGHVRLLVAVVVTGFLR
jgi:hypothetical protein